MHIIQISFQIHCHIISIQWNSILYFIIEAELIPSIINPHTLSLAADFTRSSANFNFLYDKLITKETSSKLFIPNFLFLFCSFVDTRRKKQIICTIALSVMQVKLFGISIIGRSLKNRISLLLLHYLDSNLVSNDTGEIVI